MSINGVYIGRDTWLENLDLQVSPEDLKSLPITDQGAIFDGIREFFAKADGFEVIERSEELKAQPGTSAPLLISRTRIFISFNDAVRGWFVDAVEAVVMFAVTGNKYFVPIFVGLSVDFVKKIFEKMSQLDEQDTRIVKTIIQFVKSNRGRLPTTAAIVETLKGSNDTIEARLAYLVDHGIIQYVQGGWQVTF